MQNQPDVARVWFERAQTLAPQDAMVHFHFGQFYAAIEDHRSAINQLILATKLDGENVDVWTLLANEYRLGDNMDMVGTIL